MIRTLTGDLAADRAGFVLVHEHVYCDFAEATGDPDLGFTSSRVITSELTEARVEGVALLVEVSTYDMGADPVQVAALCRAAGVLVVKSTGWFKSPWLDKMVSGTPTDALTTRLISDLCDGFAETDLRAGVIGEVGLSGPVPTSPERSALDAAVAASLATGAGIVVHTDDWRNATTILRELTDRGLKHDRIMVSHCRCEDPLSGQQEIVEAGATIAFDQLGHPHRDPIPAVAKRIEELLERGCGGRIALSADVGRLSRLRSNGGGGYIRPVRELLADLLARGVNQGVVDTLTRAAPARFLSWPSS